MKIEIKLENDIMCEGCPYLDKGWCCYYGQSVNISNSTEQWDVSLYRLQKCIKDNGK